MFIDNLEQLSIEKIQHFYKMSNYSYAESVQNILEHLDSL